MRTTTIRVVFSLLQLAAATASRTACAGAKEEARKHYDRAVELVDDGQLAEAIIEFRRSYDLTKPFRPTTSAKSTSRWPSPSRRLPPTRVTWLVAGRTSPRARRAEVEKEVARQKARIATLEIHVLPDGAVVRVDGNEIGKSPMAQPLSVGIGEHVVSATAEGHEPAEVKVTVAGEDRRTVELTLTAIPRRRPSQNPLQRSRLLLSSPCPGPCLRLRWSRWHPRPPQTFPPSPILPRTHVP